MFKISITALLVIFASFSSCYRTDQTNRGSNTQATPASQAAADSEVLILLSGLMVFHEKRPDKYEVGILKHADHKFTVKVDEKDISGDLPSVESPWTLETIPPSNASASSIVGEDYIEKERRRPDVEARQFDFGWIIDLEKFHPNLPELVPGHLKPIIELPYGALSTEYKSYDLSRWQGGSPTRPNQSLEKFGFVSEAIALRLKLPSNGKLILRGGGKEVELIPQPSRPSHKVEIKNEPKVYSENSDFHHYYVLFKNIPEAEQYHFQAYKGKDRHHPYNRFPGYKEEDLEKVSKDKRDTCCMMACTAVRTQQALR